MIIIPELQTVLILVPRTGTGTLKRAVAQRWPKSMLLYRHMEADGVPMGYDRYRRLGVVRDPIARLWSLYNFLRSEEFLEGPQSDARKARLFRSVSIPFEDWLLYNREVFCGPHREDGGYNPHFTVRNPLPENCKSQFLYLRPDLGTELWEFRDLPALAASLGLSLGLFNATASGTPPALSAEACAYAEKTFAWEYSLGMFRRPQPV